jgi:nitroreductase
MPFCCRLGAVTEELEILERLMQNRRSIRQFLRKKVPSAWIERLLIAASSAPSASNRQPYRFMVVERPETIAQMVSAVEASLRSSEGAAVFRERVELHDYGKHFSAFGSAPLVVVVFFRENGFQSHRETSSVGNSSTGTSKTDVDPLTAVRENLSSAAAAIQQLLLAAHAMGLGACWMTGPCLAEKELMALLKAPPGLRLAAIVPIGYPVTLVEAPRKRKLSQLVIAEPQPIDALGRVGADEPSQS